VIHIYNELSCIKGRYKGGLTSGLVLILGGLNSRDVSIFNSALVIIQ